MASRIYQPLLLEMLDINGRLFLFVDTSVPSQIVTLVANPNTYFLFCRPFHPPAPM